MGSNPTLSAIYLLSFSFSPRENSIVKDRKTVVSALAALSLVIFVSLSCSSISRYAKELAEKQKKERDIGNIKDDGPTKSAGSESSSALLVKKSNLYISDCFNKYATSVANSHNRYISWVRDPKAGPTGKERIVYGLYQINGDGSDCSAAVTKAKAMEPPMPELEAAADQFVLALNEVLPKVADIYGYYDKEDYKDDNFARGKAAHPELIASFENFEKINKAFGTEIDKLEDNVAEMQLDEFKDDPSKAYQYAAVNFSIKAKTIMAYVRDNEYSAMKADDLQPMIDEADTALAAVKDANKSPMSGVFSGQADGFIKAAKELMRRIRDKKPFDSFERGQLGRSGGWMVDGSPDQVINAYNQMISMRSFDRF